MYRRLRFRRVYTERISPSDNSMQKKLIAQFFFLLIALLGVWIVLSHPTSMRQQSTSNKLQVVASFYPIAEFARAVGGDLVDVNTITPAGVEPHDYEPTPQQLAAIYRSDMVFYNGGGVDVWADRISPDVSSKGISVIELGKAIPVVAAARGSSDPNTAFDPHFWLDPVLAQKEVTRIAQTFAQKDPTHANVFQKNADAYNAKLSLLDQAFQDGLRSCKLNTIVTSHAAFAYLGAEYHFQVIPISGLSPDEEPSAGRLAEISQLAKAHNVHFIYFETLVSPKLADTIANEIGAKTLVFNPLEGVTAEDQAAGKNYLTIQADNLKNLKIGLVCP